MAKQSKKLTKNSVTHKVSSADLAASPMYVDLERKQLLAHMASRIAMCVMQDPNPSTNSPEAIAEVSVDIAEAILQKIGL